MNNLLRSCFWTCGRGSYEPCRRLHAKVGKKKILKTLLLHPLSPPQIGLLLGWQPRCIHPLWISSLLDSSVPASLPGFALFQFP